MAIKVLFVRHAIAEDRDVFAKTGKSDSKRPLTELGRKEFKKVAKKIEALWEDVDLIAYSPLTRATQTAKILKKRFPDAREIQINELKPGQSSEKLLEWLRRVGRVSTVAIVGHEPSLGHHFGYFLTGKKTAIHEFKKGGFALVEFEDRIDRGAAKLLCCIQPSHLKRLGRVRTNL